MPRRSPQRSQYARPDTVYALLSGDKAVLTFAAQSLREARSITHEQWLHDDLREMRSNGSPLWDGETKLSVRPASPAEAARFVEAKEAAADGSGDLVRVYLVEIDT